jgi:hypothetical protein
MSPSHDTRDSPAGLDAGLFNALYMYVTMLSLRRNSWADCAIRM